MIITAQSLASDLDRRKVPWIRLGDLPKGYMQKRYSIAMQMDAESLGDDYPVPLRGSREVMYYGLKQQRDKGDRLFAKAMRQLRVTKLWRQEPDKENKQKIDAINALVRARCPRPRFDWHWAWAYKDLIDGVFVDSPVFMAMVKAKSLPNTELILRSHALREIERTMNAVRKTELELAK